PESATETGLLLALLVMVSVADPVPSDFGANAIRMGQVIPAANPPAQPLSTRMKSGSPVIVTPLTVITPVPVFVSEMIWVGLWVPTASLATSSTDGQTMAITGSTPVPAKDTETGPLA